MDLAAGQGILWLELSSPSVIAIASSGASDSIPINLSSYVSSVLATAWASGEAPFSCFTLSG